MNKIPVLDAGAQLYAAICRVCDEIGVEPVPMPVNVAPDKLKDYSSFIISGGGASVYENNSPSLHPRTAELMREGKWNVLGICYGMQLLTHLSGGKVTPLSVKEYGKTIITQTNDSPLFFGLPRVQRVLMSHGDSISELANGFEATAKSDSGLIAAMEDRKRGLYGVQFHPEAIPISTYGKQILANFLTRVAHYEPRESCTIDQLIEQQREYIRATVKPGQKVFCGLSGGVDSTVAAKITEEIIGPGRCVGFIMDTGGMRKREVLWVHDRLSKYLKMRIEVLNEEEAFLSRLSVASDAKAKRAAFSEVYQDAFGRAVVMANLDEKKDLMLQGTLRPDLIETAAKRVSGVARQIKQHHNVFDRFEKLEPNQHLHKDQVRRIASALGLPDELAYRQPFPGPGLFVRTICGATPTIDGNYDKATAELKQYASAHHLDALVLPIKTVGIKGDDRSYDYAAVLAGQEEWETLATHADRIPRVIHGINRVLYAFQRDLGGLDPQMLITPTFCRREELDLLREADHIVNKHQERAGMDSRQIEQFPVNLLPVHLGKRGTRTIVLRPFVTVDFYTGLPAIPAAKVENNEQIDGNLVVAMANDIRNIDGIGAVLYDLTSKPPGTTELE